jgi:hypothetical protein
MGRDSGGFRLELAAIAINPRPKRMSIPFRFSIHVLHSACFANRPIIGVGRSRAKARARELLFSIMGRRAAPQSLARPGFPLRSKLTRRPATKVFF